MFISSFSKCPTVSLFLACLQAVSIVGEELFSFELSLFPGATEGDGYSDMSKVDGRVKMRLGCIQIIYLHKFLMSLLVRHADTHIHLNEFTPEERDDDVGGVLVLSVPGTPQQHIMRADGSLYQFPLKASVLQFCLSFVPKS